MRCINMRFENCINTKSLFAKRKGFFLLPTTMGLAIFGAARFVLVVSVNCVCVQSKVRDTADSISARDNGRRSLSLTRRCKICENRQFWVWTFCLL